MADSDSNRFFRCENISDDTRFVHEAMQTLGFVCEFAELSTADMHRALALAESLKRSEICERGALCT